MKEEKVRIRVRLTEEEKRNWSETALYVVCPKASMSASSAGAFTRNQNPRMCFWRLMDELYKAHSDLKECAKYEPSALNSAPKLNGWYWTCRR